MINLLYYKLQRHAHSTRPYGVFLTPFRDNLSETYVAASGLEFFLREIFVPRVAQTNFVHQFTRKPWDVNIMAKQVT